MQEGIFTCELKCHCNEKIFDLVLNTTEQHFHTSLDGVFSFSKSCFVLEILRFFKTCKRHLLTNNKLHLSNGEYLCK